VPRKPQISLVSPETAGFPPPRPLGPHGTTLWNNVQAEFSIKDVGGRELLVQACAAVDRIEALAVRISADGEVIDTPGGPKPHPCLRDELAARTFVVRTLEKLGVTVEPVKGPGRQPSFASWIPPEQR
jgi:hypothetical protein